MRKRLLLSMLAILSVLMLVACGGSGPEQTIDDFMKDYKDLKLQDLEKYVDKDVSEDLDEVIDFEELSDLSEADLSKVEKFDDLKANFKKLTKEVKYDVTNVEENGATVTADITFTYADASKPLARSFSELLGQTIDLAFTSQELTEEELELKMAEITVDVLSDTLDGYETTTKEVQGKIEIVEKEGEWIITDIDDEIMNALTFGLIEGIDNLDPFGMEYSTELEFEDQQE